MQQPGQRQLVVFVLILLTVCIRTKLSASSPPLKERELLAAIQTPHVALIDRFDLMLKGTLTPFHAVKDLCRGFEVNTLGPVRNKT